VKARGDGMTFDEALFQNIRRVGLAVSGGADSTALAHLVAPWCACHNIEARILHVNHGLRGDASDADEKFVAALAWQLGVPCHATRVSLQTGSGVSLEMAGRDARQTFFNEARASHQLDAIVTGHHAGDVAETLLLRLLRGAGATGLSGLRPRSEIDGVTYLRPLLAHTPETLRAWLRENNHTWREDLTNTDDTIPRNLIRNRVLPWLSETFGRDVRAALLRSAEILSEEDAFMEGERPREPHAAHSCGSGGRSPSMLSVASLLPLPRALQRRVVRAMLLEHAPDASGFAIVERVLSLLEKPRWRFNVTGGEIVCDDGALAFRGNRAAPESCALRVPEDATIAEAFWHDVHIQIRRAPGILRETTAIGELPASASFAAAALRGRDITVRAWREGDRIQPFGMTGHRKIQDIFIDAKIPLWRKREIPIFCCGEEIIWLPGYRPAAAFAVVDENDAVRISVFH
jgi:tRNA(Ile)-lysidine synthase